MKKRIYKTFQEIPVWRMAHLGVLKVYEISNKFPPKEQYILTSQIRRAAISVAANIAEGFYRNTTKELIQFLYNARGSCGEVVYHLTLVKDLGYIEDSVFKEIESFYNEIGKQINGWINSLKSHLKN